MYFMMKSSIELYHGISFCMQGKAYDGDSIIMMIMKIRMIMIIIIIEMTIIRIITETFHLYSH